MNYDEARETLRLANLTLQTAKGFADRFAAILIEIGLRHVSSYHLARMKKQLKDFNSHTGKWK